MASLLPSDLLASARTAVELDGAHGLVVPGASRVGFDRLAKFAYELSLGTVHRTAPISPRPCIRERPRSSLTFAGQCEKRGRSVCEDGPSLFQVNKQNSARSKPAAVALQDPPRIA